MERATAWIANERRGEYLLRGSALADAHDLFAHKPPNAPEATELQLNFIQASDEEEARVLSAERERVKQLEAANTLAETERDAANRARDAAEAARIQASNAATRARRWLAATAVLLIAALGAGGYAYVEAERASEALAGMQIAEKGKETALIAAQKAESNARRQAERALAGRGTREGRS